MATNEFNLNKKQTKEIKYLNKDFSDFRGDLIGYAKNYFLKAMEAIPKYAITVER